MLKHSGHSVIIQVSVFTLAALFTLLIFVSFAVFGRNTPHKDNLIPARELLNYFNADEVCAYLKDRREQVGNLSFPNLCETFEPRGFYFFNPDSIRAMTQFIQGKNIHIVLHNYV